MMFMFKFLENKKIINHLVSRYGFSKEYLDQFLFLFKHKSVFVISKDKEEVIKKILNKAVFNAGIEIFADKKHFVPSSLGFSAFCAKEIKYNFVVLNRDLVVDFLKGKPFSLEQVVNRNILSKGYIVCIYDNKIVGTCLYEDQLTPNIAFTNKKAK